MVSDLDLLQDLTRALPKSRPGLDVPPGWGLRMMRARAEARDRLVKVDIIGDSIWAQGNGASDPRTTSAAGLVEARLHSRWGDGGSGFLSFEYATRTGSWSAGAECMFAGCGARATAAATMRWDGIKGTNVRLFHRNADITGSFRHRIDGGDWATVTPPTGFAQEPGLVEYTGLADVPHTVEVEWVSGSVVIHGVQGQRATGVIVNRIGQNGRAGSHYSPVLLERIPAFQRTNGQAAVSTAAPGSFRPYMTGKYVSGTGIPTDTTLTVTSATAATLSANATQTVNGIVDLQLHRTTWARSAGTTVDPAFAVGLGRPDLVIIALGANDPANADYTDATFRDGVSRWVAQYTSGTGYDFAPDFIFVIPHFANWFDTLSRKVLIASAIQGMARSVGGAVVDSWARGRRSFKFANEAGMMADNIHPSDTGHRVLYAEPVLELIPG